MGRLQFGNYKYWKKMEYWVVESKSILSVLLIYRPPNTELSGFIDEFWKLLKVTINGRDIQLSSKTVVLTKKIWDSWNCQFIRYSSNHTDYSSAILVQQEWHQLPQNALATNLPPNKLSNRTIFTDLSDHFKVLIELSCTKTTEPKHWKTGCDNLKRRMMILRPQSFSLN